MANTSNGVCTKKVVKGERVRKHEITQKMDREGRKFESCNKCGYLNVNTQ